MRGASSVKLEEGRDGMEAVADFVLTIAMIVLPAPVLMAMALRGMSKEARLGRGPRSADLGRDQDH